MNAEKIKEIDNAQELPDAWWYRVYLAVIITTVVVISALGFFTNYFSR